MKIAISLPKDKTVASESLTWQFRAKVILASLANLLVLSYIHYLTRFEFLFLIFYFVPVSLCGWYMGRRAVVSMAILSGICWCFMDILSNHEYPHEVFRYANSFLCFLAFASIGILVQGLRHSLAQQKKARTELETALQELQRSTDEIRKLQSQIQVVCAWTKRINVEGKWIGLDQFLTEKLKAQVSFGVSPEALQNVLNSGGVEPAPAPALAEATH